MNPLEKYGAVPADPAPAQPTGNPLAQYGAIPAGAVPESSNPLAKYGAVAADSAPVEQPLHLDAPPSNGRAPTTTADDGRDLEKLAGRRDDHTIDSADAEYIAAKHDVPLEFVRDAIGWMGGVRSPEERHGIEHITESLKSVAGAAGEGIGMGLPQGAWKKFGGHSENERRALDDLQRLVDERKSMGQVVGETALGLTVPVGIAGRIGKAGSAASRAAHIGEAAAIGASAGYAHSSEDNEGLSTAVGGLVGGALGVGADRLAARAARRAAATAAERGAAPEVAAQVGAAVEHAERTASADAVAAARTKMEALAEPEAALERAVVDTPEVREAAQTNNIQKFMDATTPEEREAIAKLSEHTNLGPRQVEAHGEDAVRAWKVTKEAAEDFGKRVGDDVEGYVAREGADHARAQLRTAREAQYVQNAIIEQGERGGLTGTLRRARDFMSDLRHVTDSIDRRFGVRLTPLMDKLSGNFNRFSSDYVRQAERGAGLNKLLLTAERDPPPAGSVAKRFDLTAALEEAPGEISKYTPKQQAAIQEWRRAFEEARVHARDLGLPIPKTENYVPRMARDPVEFVTELDDMARELKLNVRDPASMDRVLIAARKAEAAVGAGEHVASGDQAARDLIRGLEYVSGGTPARTKEQLRAAIEGLGDLQQVSTRLATRASATFRRGEESLPLRLLERDPTKLWMKWNHNTLRHAYMRGDLTELRAAADALRGVGLERRADGTKFSPAAEYLDRLVQDLVGPREGTVAASQGRWVAQKQLDWARAARAAPAGSAKRLVSSMMAELPNMLAGATHNIYPFALGARPDKILENLTSPILVGIPSTGAKAFKHWLGAMGDFGGDLVRSKFRIRRMEEELVARGLMPRDQPLDSHRWMREGLERSMPRVWGRWAIDKAADWAMKAYRRTDGITRGVTLRAAERMSAALMHDAHLRADLLSHMGAGTAAQVDDLIRAGRVDDVTTEVARWLNGYTQFNYNRASMSEYGRTMGGLFSTFSKWPTSTVGEVASRLEAGANGKMTPELMKLTVKYLGPLLALRIVGAGIMAKDGYSTGEVADAATHGGTMRRVVADHPGAEYWVGSNPEGWTPIGTVKGLLDNPFATAPAVRFSKSALTAVTEGDRKVAGAAAAQAAMMFAPGNWVLRMYYQDLPTFRGEGRPGQRTDQLLLDDLGIGDDD
jgi:hypothetical protein